MTHPDRKPDRDLCDGDVLAAGGIELRVITTPGHSPGSVVPVRPGAGHGVHRRHALLGRAGRDRAVVRVFATIIDSIATRLLTLPGDTTVRTGHGDTTTIGTELPHLEEWIVRGH